MGANDSRFDNMQIPQSVLQRQRGPGGMHMQQQPMQMPQNARAMPTSQVMQPGTAQFGQRQISINRTPLTAQPTPVATGLSSGSVQAAQAKPVQRAPIGAQAGLVAMPSAPTAQHFTDFVGGPNDSHSQWIFWVLLFIFICVCGAIINMKRSPTTTYEGPPLLPAV